MIGHKCNIAELTAVKISQRLKSIRTDGCSPSIFVLAALDQNFRCHTHIIVELIWCTGTNSSTAIHEQLFEIPFTGSNFRYTGLPDSVFTALETCDYLTA